MMYHKQFRMSKYVEIGFMSYSKQLPLIFIRLEIACLKYISVKQCNQLNLYCLEYKAFSYGEDLLKLL